MRNVGPEAARSYRRRTESGFFQKYLSGQNILDIGFQGSDPNSVPIVENAIGVGLDYPGYDGIHLPFPEGSQDAVFASHCYEHIGDYRSALREWYRVLRPGGYVVVLVPHKYLYERKSTPPSLFNADHKRFYTPAALLREFEDALPVNGFRVRHLADNDSGFDYGMPIDSMPPAAMRSSWSFRKSSARPIPTCWSFLHRAGPFSRKRIAWPSTWSKGCSTVASLIKRSFRSQHR